ncbi:hypothetical protein [Paenibacillus sp. TC-CSREp1]|uniref:hypothetical protein n=1 Tax=Paenibacillus sp. TC-CSREp1 TaxID=3410089 RepID=UPI003CECED09
MSAVNVSWNYHDIDTTYDYMEKNADACVLYIEGDPEYNEHIGLSAAQAEYLIVDLRNMLDKLYVKEDAE